MQTRHGRRGSVFPLRLTDDERLELEALRESTAGPEGLGPWLVWAARQAAIAGVLPTSRPLEEVIPWAVKTIFGPSFVMGNPIRGVGVLARNRERRVEQSNANKLILDLCGGSGSWSAPYEAAGYSVVRVDILDGFDVRTMALEQLDEEPVHGILAAPPCTEFSLAKNGQERDIRAGLEVVSACLRIVCACEPQWWALENPTGLLSAYLGTPRDVWEPYEFGDPWTKRTALWGDFRIPERGPFVKATGSAMDRRGAAARAVTPPGFARAFFEANP